MVKYLRHDALLVGAIATYHRVCLPTAGLSIRKDSPIIPLKRVFNQRKCGFAINLLLRGVLVEHIVKPECFVLITGAHISVDVSERLEQRDLPRLLIDLDSLILIVRSLFSIEEGSASYNDSDTFLAWFLVRLVMRLDGIWHELGGENDLLSGEHDR